MTAAIQLDGVTFTYQDGTRALEELSFTICNGECVGIAGASGAGKSTLISCAVGFATPEKGKITVGEIELTRKNLKEVREKIGLIFQNPDDQLFMPTVYDDVAFGLVQRNMGKKLLDRKVKKTLADRGLEGMEHKFPGHLSGGQKRLAALAGVLVMEPEILLLDEPSSHLDPPARRNLISHLDGLENTRLITGHDLEMILDLCNRVILLRSGKVVADGDPFEIFGDAGLMKYAGLEVPHSLLPHRHEHRRRREHSGEC